MPTDAFSNPLKILISDKNLFESAVSTALLNTVGQSFSKYISTATALYNFATLCNPNDEKFQ